MLLLPTGLWAQQTHSPKYEYRAVWLTTIENLDWPRTQVSSPDDVAVQQRELIVVLDSLQALNINTVLLQTRVRGDLIYPSHIEPFSHVFTGVEGRSPGYDPLAFAIEECHKRGMQLHAWLVTLPIGKPEHIKRLGATALPRKRRELCTYHKGAWYIEPGNPDAADYIAAIVGEIVGKYDVDGIHLDYVRYPDRTDGYPDASLFRKHGNGLSLAEWRRSNITRIAERVSDTVRLLKPWVRVSCAPLGKYRSLARYSSYEWDAYGAVFQDAQAWLRNGLMDILFPMLYYKGDNFYPFVLDWLENSNGRHIVPGLGIYRLMEQYGGWPSIEIERQMHTSRSANADGVIMFRTAHLVGNAGGARDIYSSIYTKPALVPPMEWAAEAPSSPQFVDVVRDESGVSLRWSAVEAPAGHPVTRYNVYASLNGDADVENIDNLLSNMQAETTFRWDCRTVKSVNIAVTAVNAFGIESAPLCVNVPTGGEKYCGDAIELPEPQSWGQRIELLDLCGTRLYFGKYKMRFSLASFAPGCYILNVYDRHGALLETRHIVR